MTPPNLPYSIGLAGRSYNGVYTAVLHCDKSETSPHQVLQQLGLQQQIERMESEHQITVSDTRMHRLHRFKKVAVYRPTVVPPGMT